MKRNFFSGTVVSWDLFWVNFLLLSSKKMKSRSPFLPSKQQQKRKKENLVFKSRFPSLDISKYRQGNTMKREPDRLFFISFFSVINVCFESFFSQFQCWITVSHSPIMRTISFEAKIYQLKLFSSFFFCWNGTSTWWLTRNILIKISLSLSLSFSLYFRSLHLNMSVVGIHTIWSRNPKKNKKIPRERKKENRIINFGARFGHHRLLRLLLATFFLIINWSPKSNDHIS